MDPSNNNKDNCVPSVLSGITQDLLDNAEDTDSSKILNALDFPLWDGIRDGNVYATDMAAWDVTRGLHTFDPSALYPTGDVRWGLAGLKHSISFLHLDPDGFHTENTIAVGGKAWVFYETALTSKHRPPTSSWIKDSISMTLSIVQDMTSRS